MVSTKKNWKKATNVIHADLVKAFFGTAQPKVSTMTARFPKSSVEVVKIVQTLIGYIVNISGATRKIALAFIP